MYGDVYDVVYANFPSLPYSYIRWRFDALLPKLNGFGTILNIVLGIIASSEVSI